MEKWKSKFPDVAFTDKVVVIMDGKEHFIKHLYHEDGLKKLNDIDWDRVDDCFDV